MDLGGALKHAAIVGAGVTGLLMAIRMRQMQWRITVIDADERDGQQSCTYTGAGMLAPYCELEHSLPVIAELGADSLAKWKDLLGSINYPVKLEQQGSLAVAHPDDRADLDQLQQRVEEYEDAANIMRVVDASGIRQLEPGMENRFTHGLYFPQEGHINNRELLSALKHHLTIDTHTDLVYGMPVERTEPGHIHCHNGVSQHYDLVVDCRGLGARSQVHDLRGVRGELIYIRTPEVQLHRPIRLMHPRYPLYVVPRSDQVFVIGATQIESDHPGPTTVRASLELLSAAYALHPAFAEAEILESRAACRPAFPDNLPRILVEEGLLQVNGLFRHGFLLAPTITQMAAEIIEGKNLQEFPQSIVQQTQ